MNRDNIDKKYKWDLDVIYSSVEEFEKDFDEVRDVVYNIKKYENIMNNGSKYFYETIEYYYNVSKRLEKLYMYAHLLFDADTSDNSVQSL